VSRALGSAKASRLEFTATQSIKAPAEVRTSIQVVRDKENCDDMSLHGAGAAKADMVVGRKSGEGLVCLKTGKSRGFVGGAPIDFHDSVHPCLMMMER
jgi:hypothetical protein